MNKEPEIEEITQPVQGVQTVEVGTVKELEDVLFLMDTYILRIDFNGKILRFTKEVHENITYYVQRSENELYGMVFYNGLWIYSYPHMKNIRDSTEFTLESCNLEEKVNGTHVSVGRYLNSGGNKIDVVRTRMSPFPTEFPVPAFWNSTIDGMVRKDIAARITENRKDMLERHPDWYINAGEGEYVGLKVQEVVRKLIDVEEILDTHPEYNFHFELIGKCNPIIIDSELEFGMYGFDIKLILIDIFDKRIRAFVDRNTKEEIAEELSLTIIPVKFSFSTIKDLRYSIAGIKKYAETHKIEGFVIKNGAEMVKIKPDAILQSAYRLNSIMKGHLFTPDLVDYIAKIVTLEYLSQPEDFDKLVDLIAGEARADYTGEIVLKNMGRIRKILAHEMALMVTVQILEEQEFGSRDEMFRFINTELPKRFEPLKSYIDFEVEKTTTDKALAKRMKRRRKDLMRKVTKYCLKKWDMIESH
ncbi:hypothetical protein KAU33_02535 [Candidatus Dependentiae bacterium]|nr:hypothetical protein [Candidatus Dependentiae bacterium]